MAEKIVTTEIVTTNNIGFKAAAVAPSMVQTAQTQVETGPSMRKSRTSRTHQVPGSTTKTIGTTNMMATAKTTPD
jgi:hypothetical protein